MNLESLTMEVRPRTSWESMDLAVRLAVSHWYLLFSSWMVTVFPLFLLINLVLLKDHPYWAFILFWFLKPLYDRVPLFVLSRVIFSEKLSWKDVVNAIPSFFKTGIFSSLTLYRLDPGRAFALPVRQLEGLEGKRRRQRMSALNRGVNNREVLFFILCFHLESLMTWSVMGMIFIMLPTQMALEGAGTLFDGTEPGLLLNSVSMVLYFIIMMIVETLYVAGGFVLYLNRRIILEGWDIELVFRKLRQRQAVKQQKQQSYGKKGSLNSSLPVVIVTLFCSLMVFPDVQAASLDNSASYENILPPIASSSVSPDESKKIIQAVMADPVFNQKKTIETLKYIGPEKKDSTNQQDTQSMLTDIFEAIGHFIAFVFEAGLWVLLLIALYLLIKHRERLNFGFWRKRKPVMDELPEMLFGLDLREESLPDDVTEQALLYFQQGDYRASLALLYRATLAYLVRNYRLTLGQGATEGDCLELVTQKIALPSEAAVTYFIDLTRAWQITAYAHRQISAQQMEQLCRDWPGYFDDQGRNIKQTQGKEDE